MLTRSWPKLVVLSSTVILLVAAFHAWRADRRDRAQLAAELASTKQLLAAADARQHDRDAQLAQTLSALEAQKRAIVTPAQIVRELQKNIPLPEPLALQQPSQTNDARRGTIYRAPIGAAITQAPRQESQTAGEKPAATFQPAQASAQPEGSPEALIPRADLKPLYDFTLDCQACQAKLSAAQGDLADEKTKTAALTKDRDDAVRLAKGGSAWHRITRAAKWFLLGAAAGAVVAKTR